MADITLSDQNFEEKVMKSDIPVVVDFWAPWCVPCKVINPLMDELSEEFKGKVVIGKINADENPQVVEQMNIMSMPTVMFFKGGRPVNAIVGGHGKHTYTQAINELLSA